MLTQEKQTESWIEVAGSHFSNELIATADRLEKIEGHKTPSTKNVFVGGFWTDVPIEIETTKQSEEFRLFGTTTDRISTEKENVHVFSEKLKSIGIKPIAILPKTIWEKLCRKSNLVRFEKFDKKGLVPFNFFIESLVKIEAIKMTSLDKKYSNLFQLSIKVIWCAILCCIYVFYFGLNEQSFLPAIILLLASLGTISGAYIRLWIISVWLAITITSPNFWNIVTILVIFVIWVLMLWGINTIGRLYIKDSILNKSKLIGYLKYDKVDKLFFDDPDIYYFSLDAEFFNQFSQEELIDKFWPNGDDGYEIPEEKLYLENIKGINFKVKPEFLVTPPKAVEDVLKSCAKSNLKIHLAAHKSVIRVDINNILIPNMVLNENKQLKYTKLSYTGVTLVEYVKSMGNCPIGYTIDETETLVAPLYQFGEIPNEKELIEYIKLLNLNQMIN